MQLAHVVKRNIQAIASRVVLVVVVVIINSPRGRY